MPRTPDQNLSDAPPATPGYLTTEFWKTTIFTVVSLLIATGVITPAGVKQYKPILDGVALLAPAIALAFYSMSRGKTKAAAIEAAANVVVATRHIQLQRDAANLPSATEQVGGEA